jgi:hypothetical protein
MLLAGASLKSSWEDLGGFAYKNKSIFWEHGFGRIFMKWFSVETVAQPRLDAEYAHIFFVQKTIWIIKYVSAFL